MCGDYVLPVKRSPLVILLYSLLVSISIIRFVFGSFSSLSLSLSLCFDRVFFFVLFLLAFVSIVFEFEAGVLLFLFVFFFFFWKEEHTPREGRSARFRPR